MYYVGLVYIKVHEISFGVLSSCLINLNEKKPQSELSLEQQAGKQPEDWSCSNENLA